MVHTVKCAYSVTQLYSCRGIHYSDILRYWKTIGEHFEASKANLFLAPWHHSQHLRLCLFGFAFVLRIAFMPLMLLLPETLRS